MPKNKPINVNAPNSDEDEEIKEVYKEETALAKIKEPR